MVWTAVVLLFGVLPTHATLQAVAGEGEGTLTMAGHFFEFAALAFLVAMAWDGRPSWRTFVRAAAVAVAIGVVVELVQGPLPYRDCQLSDVGVDTAGAALGLLTFSLVASWRGRTSRARRG